MISTHQFLSMFWSPLVVLLPDIKGAKECDWIDWAKHQSSGTLFEKNKELPFGLFFTPNGNYWAIQEIGKKISRSSMSPGPWPIYNALCVDIDLKDTSFKTKAALEEHIHATLNTYKIGISFIVESQWGYHLYRMIHPDHRESVEKMIGKKFFSISQYLRDLFGWCMWCQATKVVNGLLRVPGGFHHKTGDAFEVKIVHHDEKVQLTLDNLEIFLKNVKENDIAVKTQQDAPTVFGMGRADTINKIPLPYIIEKLEKYPRYINGVNQVFRIKGNSIAIVLEDGTIVETDGYKYKKDWNYAHNFSSTEHNILERPRWEPYAFLKHYFAGNVDKVKYFLTTEFWIEMEDNTMREAEVSVKMFMWEDFTIDVTNKRVTLNRQVHTKWWWLITVPKDLFAIPIKIIGKSSVRVSLNGAESDVPQSVFLFEIKWINTIIYRFSGKRKFNDRYAGQWLFFFGEDNDLGYFFDVLDKSDIPEIQIITHNGIYDNCVVLGDKCLIGDTEWKYIATNAVFDINTTKQQVSVKDYFDAIKTLYKEHLIVPAFLQTLAMAAMNLWEWSQVYPGILLTGITWCWKSSIRDICLGAIWYSKTSRIVALPQISPQPLKVMATDNSILTLNELTMSVKEQVEEQVRNIINKDTWARWVGVDNIHYNFRSPLFILWERTFKDESLNNRVVVLVMSKEDWIPGMMGDVIKVQDFSCYNDLYTTYLTNKEDLNEMHMQYSYKLAQQWVDPRTAEVRSYMFVANKIFDLGYNRVQLCEMMNLHLKNMGFDREDETTNEWALQMRLSKIIFARKAQCIVEDYGSKRILRVIFIDEALYEKARGRFTLLINKINLHAEDGIPRLSISKEWVTISIHTGKPLAIDFVMWKIEQFILTLNRTNVSLIDVSDGSTYQEGSF